MTAVTINGKRHDVDLPGDTPLLWALRDYGGEMRQGLIPNRFVEQGELPEYNTADATLWLANAIHKTLEAKWDEEFAAQMLDVLEEVYDWHVLGTLYGIRVDPEDGLLTQGEPGVQLTWMDVKIDGRPLGPSEP